MACASTAEDHFRKSAERPVAPAARLLRRRSSAPGVQLRWDPRLFNLSVLHHFQLALTANTHKVCRPPCPILHKQLTQIFARACSRTQHVRVHSTWFRWCAYITDCRFTCKLLTNMFNVHVLRLLHLRYAPFRE